MFCVDDELRRANFGHGGGDLRKASGEIACLEKIVTLLPTFMQLHAPASKFDHASSRRLRPGAEFLFNVAVHLRPDVVVR